MIFISLVEFRFNFINCSKLSSKLDLIFIHNRSSLFYSVPVVVSIIFKFGMCSNLSNINLFEMVLYL